MITESEHWKGKDSAALFEAILALKNVSECEKFFRDVLTLRELEEAISRFKIARMLNAQKPKPYLEIAEETGASTTTVTRVAQWLRHGAGGYRLILDRIK